MGRSPEHRVQSAYISMMPFAIPEAELEFQTSRASGPGGQHVNKTETRVEAVWDVTASPSLTENQRERILRKLSNRIDGFGRLRVATQEHRSQARNKTDAIARLNELVNAALRVPRPRKKTKPSRAAVERRIQGKKQKSEKKRRRRQVRDDE